MPGLGPVLFRPDTINTRPLGGPSPGELATIIPGGPAPGQYYQPPPPWMLPGGNMILNPSLVNTGTPGFQPNTFQGVVPQPGEVPNLFPHPGGQPDIGQLSNPYQRPPPWMVPSQGGGLTPRLSGQPQPRMGLAGAPRFSY